MRLNLVLLRRKTKPTPEEVEARKPNAKNRKGLLQEEMAKRFKTSRPHYSDIETGKAEPTIEMAYILREEFGVDDVLECLKVFEVKE